MTSLFTKMENPYLEEIITTTLRKYNPEYGDDRMCECGHVYYRHFDTYEDMDATGCKYCQCGEFIELNSKELKRISKIMSHALRHNPEKYGIKLDAGGWTHSGTFIDQLSTVYSKFCHGMLDLIVQTNDKKRFEFNDDGTKIRACQGHSIPVDLGLTPRIPPDYLYHGTTSSKYLDIKETGISKMSRTHVHLSEFSKIALEVARRHSGIPVVLRINTLGMWMRGYEFVQSSNDVWLVDHVPPEFIDNLVQ